jgi:hypothetical protein
VLAGICPWDITSVRARAQVNALRTGAPVPVDAHGARELARRSLVAHSAKPVPPKPRRGLFTIGGDGLLSSVGSGLVLGAGGGGGGGAVPGIRHRGGPSSHHLPDADSQAERAGFDGSAHMHSDALSSTYSEVSHSFEGDMRSATRSPKSTAIPIPGGGRRRSGAGEHASMASSYAPTPAHSMGCGAVTLRRIPDLSGSEICSPADLLATNARH